jgi:hypothetical protein
MNMIKLAFMATASILLCACNSDSSQIEKPKVVSANDWCIQEVKNTLKDPDSATFKDVLAVKSSDKNITFCRGMVNAKNSMGGYVGYRSFQRFEDGSIYIPQ